MKDEVAFIIIEEGDKAYIDKIREYRIYFDGRVKGLSYKHRVINYALPVFLRMKALERELEEERRYIKHLQKRLGDLE